MLVYMFIGVSIVIIGFFLKNNRSNLNHKLYFIISGAILVFFAGFRGDFCTDYRSYYDYFMQIDQNYTFQDIWKGTFYNEKGYVFLNKIIGLFTDSSVVFMFLFSLLTIAFFFIVLDRYSQCAWLSVLLFVGIGTYYISFNVTRQIFASAIYFLGFKYLNERKFFKYCVVVFVAFMIHRTAILLIPIYFLLTTDITRKKIIYYAVLSTAAYIMLPTIVTVIRIVLPSYNNFNLTSSKGSINWMVVPVALLLFVWFVIKARKVDEEFVKSSEISISLNALILYALFTFLGIQVQLVSRMATYMQPFVWILIPNIINEYKNRRERQIIVGGIVCLAVLYPMVTLSGTGYDPYYFIWTR